MLQNKNAQTWREVPLEGSQLGSFCNKQEWFIWLAVFDISTQKSKKIVWLTWLKNANVQLT